MLQWEINMEHMWEGRICKDLSVGVILTQGVNSHASVVAFPLDLQRSEYVSSIYVGIKPFQPFFS